MNGLLERWRRASWAERLWAVSGLAGIAVAARIVLGAKVVDPRLVGLTIGLAVAWSAALAALLGVGLALFEHFKRRSPTFVGSHVPWWIVLQLGAGIALAMAFLLSYGFGESQLIGVIAALAAVAVAWRFRGRPPASLRTTLLMCAAVVLGFQLPREAGSYSLHWNSVEHALDWTGQQSQNCSGMNLGDRPDTLAAYHPQPVIAPQLGGALGQLVNAQLGEPPEGARWAPGSAEVRVTGHLDYGDLPCYLPLFKSDHIRGNVTLQVSFAAQGDPPEDWSITCNATNALSVDIDVTSTGIASCRDLAKVAATRIAETIRTETAKITG